MFVFAEHEQVRTNPILSKEQHKTQEKEDQDTLCKVAHNRFVHNTPGEKKATPERSRSHTQLNRAPSELVKDIRNGRYILYGCIVPPPGTTRSICLLTAIVPGQTNSSNRAPPGAKVSLTFCSNRCEGSCWTTPREEQTKPYASPCLPARPYRNISLLHHQTFRDCYFFQFSLFSLLLESRLDARS